jgi:hypothetical protein
MPATVSTSHDYNASPDRVWQVATSWDCLREAVRGLIDYEPLPDEPMHQGQVIKTNVSLFGRLPPFPYVMEVVHFDPEARTFASHEYGGAVKAWNHTLTVAPTPDGARLDDTIEIDAGWLTPIYALWAKFMYARRHKPRLRMLSAR